MDPNNKHAYNAGRPKRPADGRNAAAPQQDTHTGDAGADPAGTAAESWLPTGQPARERWFDPAASEADKADWQFGQPAQRPDTPGLFGDAEEQQAETVGGEPPGQGAARQRMPAQKIGGQGTLPRPAGPAILPQQGRLQQAGAATQQPEQQASDTRDQRYAAGNELFRPAGYRGVGGQDDLDSYLPPAVPKKPRKRWPKVVIALSLVVLLLGGGVLGVLLYLDYNVFVPGQLGTILNLGNEPRPYSKKDVVHILIVGIDNEEGRSYGAGLGLTDMLLYCRYELKTNQLNMLQIPRDSYVGDSVPTGGTGKINALLISGKDKENPINNLASVFTQQFQLPLDYYIAMDMDALKTIVNTFGGLKVYVPRDMSYQGSMLLQGWRWLDGDAAEFFVRNRHGVGFERGDIDRLDNQRHFYSALFRRFLNLTPRDIVNLLPVFKHYCNTDITMDDLFSLAVSGLNLKAENVMFCKVPGATGSLDPSGKGRSLYFIDLYGRGTAEDPGLASILNDYFRDPERPVSAEQLGLPQIKIPGNMALYPPNIQKMAEVQEPEGGADVDVEPGA